MRDCFGNKLEPGFFFAYSVRRGDTAALNIGIVLAEGVFLGSSFKGNNGWVVNSQPHKQFTPERSVKVFASQVPIELQADLWAKAKQCGY